MLFIFKNVLCFVFLFLQGIEGAWANTDGLKHILDRGELIVGVCKIDQPPFYSRDKNGVLKGFDIDIAKGLSEGLGVKLRIDENAANWDALVDLLKEKKIDLAISFLSKNTARAKFILFSFPYAKINEAFLVNRLILKQAMAHGRNTLDSLFEKNSGEKLAVYEGSSYVKFAEALFKDVELVKYTDQKDIVSSVRSGKHIALISDQLEIKNYLDATPEAKLKLIPLTIKNAFDLIAVGITPGNYDLLQFVNTYLQTNNINIDVSTLPRLGEEDEQLSNEGR
ncbi:MAG: ABC transporter substrate-binding protein [Alphaproteobacteria bacterium]|nr:ABC transporter substrate-binding protein [Alphaproteobacteria bacterium]